MFAVIVDSFKTSTINLDLCESIYVHQHHKYSGEPGINIICRMATGTVLEFICKPYVPDGVFLEKLIDQPDFVRFVIHKLCNGFLDMSIVVKEYFDYTKRGKL